MRNFFYLRLAFSNIKKNGKFYFPYLLTCVFTVMMFYIIVGTATNSGLSDMRGGTQLATILFLGCFVVGLFAAIFLFYTNSFLMKRRQKEIGLFNILGMEKRHIAKILFYETVIAFICGIAGGVLCGLLFSKLVMLGISKLSGLSTTLEAGFSIVGFVASLVLFGAIFVLVLIFNLVKIRLAKPIELLYGGSKGEKEPKTRIVMAILGFSCMAVGYGMALSVENALTAFNWFFIAVILVIIGTYFIFTAGINAVLKLLRKNKKYYYKTKHFISVSGMLYRMKQNAAGLANICILSTMVLVMISTTVCLYIGAENSLGNNYPDNITIVRKYSESSPLDTAKAIEQAEKYLQESGLDGSLTPRRYLQFSAVRSGDTFSLESNSYSSSMQGSEALIFVTADSYALMGGERLNISPGEAMVFTNYKNNSQLADIGGKRLKITKHLDSFPESFFENNVFTHSCFFVVADESEMSELFAVQLSAYGKNSSAFSLDIGINLKAASAEQIIKLYEKIADENESPMIYQTYTDENGEKAEEGVSVDYTVACRDFVRSEFYILYGGLLFVGIFLGILFMMAAVLIIYYKQVSEGYEDKARFEIMTKVGLSKAETKSTIRSQVLFVFFLPLATAVIHVLAAFRMIEKMLLLFSLTNVSLFIACTGITALVFGLIYALVYVLTARTYYKIVG